MGRNQRRHCVSSSSPDGSTGAKFAVYDCLVSCGCTYSSAFHTRAVHCPSLSDLTTHNRHCWLDGTSDELWLVCSSEVLKQSSRHLATSIRSSKTTVRDSSHVYSFSTSWSVCRAVHRYGRLSARLHTSKSCILTRWMYRRANHSSLMRSDDQ